MNKVSASLADGRTASVSMQGRPDGGSQVVSVQMPDGTVLSREGGTNRWSAGGGAVGGAASGDVQPHTVWEGDIRLNQQGQLRFVYQYEKVPSLVSVEARLPDGSRLALVNTDGSLRLPGRTVDALSERLADAAVKSVSGLDLDITPDRLRVGGVSTGAGVNTRYVIDLNSDEAANIIRLAATNAGIKIVPEGDPIGPIAGPCASFVATASENVSGAYEYDTPMPDHTSSVALFSRGDDGQWKVITGLRERPPFAGHAALPGGFLDRAGGMVEDPADAATRELTEETGIKTTSPALVRIGDALGRDTRNRIIDFQYAAVASKEDMAGLFAGDDLKDLQVQDVQKLLDDPSALAFDHHAMLQAAYDHLLASQSAVSPVTEAGSN